MFCVNCGEAIADNSEICPFCNTVLINKNSGQTIVVESQQNEEKEKLSKKFIVLGAIILIAFLMFIGVREYQKKELQQELLRDWVRYEDLTLILDFSEDEIEYQLETGFSYLDTTVATFDYKVISGNKIKVKRFDGEPEIFTIEFDEEKEMMIVTPAIVSTDSTEYWFNFE